MNLKPLNKSTSKPMNNDSLNRKDFFKKVSLFGIGALGATTLLKACGGGDDAPAPTMDSAGAPSADPCGTEGLSESEIAGRDALNYIGQTEIPEQRCDNCALWIAPEAGSPCGGCAIMAGPINPAGWCTAWVAG